MVVSFITHIYNGDLMSDKFELFVNDELIITESLKAGEQTAKLVNGYRYELKYTVVKAEKLYKDKEWLVNAYVEEEKTMAEIGRMFNVSPMTICTWLEKFGIQTRSRGRR